jgi:rRNA-processing protein FCF1
VHTDLRAGRTGQETVEAIRFVRNALVNARGRGGTQDQQMMAYVDWATTQAEYLQSYVSRRDIERLVLTRDFYSLFDNSTGSSPRGFPLLSGEIRSRLDDLDAVTDTLERQVKRWETANDLVVLDTNVYVHAPESYNMIDLAPYVGAESWHLLIPLVVIDELDRLKRSSGTSDGGDKVRSRARQALRLIEGGVATGDVIYPQDASTVEVVMDPDRHVRLPSADDEIIDRAITIQKVAGRVVHLVTSDTGMLFRARAAGLSAHRIETGNQSASASAVGRSA